MPHGRQTDGTADNPHARRRSARTAATPTTPERTDEQHPQTEPRQGREKL